MHSLYRTAAATAALVLLAAVPAAAQDYTFDVGIFGGYFYFTSALDSEDLAAAAGAEDDAAVRFEDGGIVGAQATWWPGFAELGNVGFGIRANFGYTERPLIFDSERFADEEPVTVGDEEVDPSDVINDVNIWHGTGDILFRFLGSDAREFVGIQFIPYLALGAGATWIDSGAQSFAFCLPGADPQADEISDSDQCQDGDPFNVAGEDFLLGEGPRLTGLAGLGADIRLAERFALRLELGDRFFDAPIYPLDPDSTFGFALRGGGEGEIEDVGNVIHELYAQLGAHFLFGLEEPEPVAVVPAPPRVPEAPEPVVLAEDVVVCVVDPDVPAGLREVEALYLPETGDTVVVEMGDTLALEEAEDLDDVITVEDADFYLTGAPLVLEPGDERVEFVTFGTARVIDPTDLAFVGTVDGLPVYANEDEVFEVRDEIEDLADEEELEEILEEQEDVREAFRDIDVLYVPLEPVGCVFQPLRRVEEVTK